MALFESVLRRGGAGFARASTPFVDAEAPAAICGGRFGAQLHNKSIGYLGLYLVVKGMGEGAAVRYFFWGLEGGYNEETPFVSPAGCHLPFRVPAKILR